MNTKRILSLSILVLLTVCFLKPADAAMDVKLSGYRGNGGRLAWSPDGAFVVFDRKGRNGGYDLYITHDFKTEKCLTCNHPDLPNQKRNYGQPVIHPNGRYVVFQAEKQKHVPLIVSIVTNPGSGVFNDLWVYDLQTNRAKPLWVLPNKRKFGVLHPQFSYDGKKLSWSQLYGNLDFKHPGKGAGSWKIMVADFSPEGLMNVKEFQPGEDVIYENHGFSHDGQWLFFSSNMKRSLPVNSSTNIYKLHLQTQQLIQLTTEGYNEHAHVSPDGKYIVWMSSVGNGDTYDYYKVGSDYWIMNIDGSNKQRLTSLNDPEHPHFRGRYATVADFDWDPASSEENGYRIYAYLHELVLKNLRIPATDKSAKGEYNFWVEFNPTPTADHVETDPNVTQGSSEESLDEILPPAVAELVPAHETTSGEPILVPDPQKVPAVTQNLDSIDTTDGYFFSYEAKLPRSLGYDSHRVKKHGDSEMAHCEISTDRDSLYCWAKIYEKKGPQEARTVSFRIQGFSVDRKTHHYPWRSYHPRYFRNASPEKNTDFAMAFSYASAKLDNAAGGKTRVNQDRPVGQRFVNEESSVCTITTDVSFKTPESTRGTVRGKLSCQRLWTWHLTNEVRDNEVGPIDIEGEFYLNLN